MDKYYKKLTLAEKKTIDVCLFFDCFFEGADVIAKSNDYLGSLNNKNVREILEKMRHLTKIEQEMNKDKFFWTIEAYNHIISQMTILLKELGLIKSIYTQYSAATRLINDGILSYGGSFEYANVPELLSDIVGYFGMDVILGKGCCRHTAELLNRIMSSFDNKTYEICSASEKTGLDDHSLVLIKDNNQYIGLESLGVELYFLKKDGSLWRMYDYFKKDGKPDGYLRTATSYYAGYFENPKDLKKFFNAVTHENKQSITDICNDFKKDDLIVTATLEDSEQLIKDFKEDIVPYQNKIYQRLRK